MIERDIIERFEGLKLLLSDQERRDIVEQFKQDLDALFFERDTILGELCKAHREMEDAIVDKDANVKGIKASLEEVLNDCDYWVREEVRTLNAGE